MASPAIGAKSLLVSATVGSATPTADWSIHVSKMPDGEGVPDRAIAIFDTGGGEENANPKWLLDYRTIQIRVRARQDEYADAYAKIAQCKDVLLGLPPTTVGGDEWNSVTSLGDITFLGRDDNDRPELVYNLQIIMEPADSVLTNREVL